MEEKFVFYEIYPGRKSGFFAVMDHLLSKFDYVIGFENDFMRVIHDDRFRTPHRDVWRIHHLERVQQGDIRKTNRQGLIIAREEEEDRTAIEFIDGYTWHKFRGLRVQDQHCSQIGVGFDRLVKRITEEWQ